MQSLDSFIAKNLNDNLSWGSKEDKLFFKEKTKKIGTMILGSKTFESMPIRAFDQREAYVMTSNSSRYQKESLPSNINFFKGSPKELIQKLENIGKKEAVVIGGGSIYQSFLQTGLVNELWITIAPKLFGGGISSFNQFKNSENIYDIDLELLDFTKLSKNEIILKYRICLTNL